MKNDKPTLETSSIAVDKRVKDYISEDCKYYYLPLFKQTLFPEFIQGMVGCNNIEDRSLLEIESSAIKAQVGRYSHIKIPLDRAPEKKIQSVFKEARKQQLGVVLQVCTSFLFDDHFFNELLSLDCQYQIEWLFDSYHELMDQRVQGANLYFSSYHVTVPVVRNTDWAPIFNSLLFKKTSSIHLYFSYQNSLDSPYLNCKDSHKVIGFLRKKFPQKVFLPAKGVDLWDFRARHDFDMEPFVLPCFSTQSSHPAIKFSVVIPSFNNQNHLRVVLRHLYKQNVGLDQFEVIVVDDGGTDKTQPLVLEWLESLDKPMNFSYVFFPRVRPREMGDSQYRAGISRNLGVKNAKGEILCFLDSDIVVSEDYLSSVDKALENSDATQAKRLNLSKKASHLGCEIQKINKQQDLIPIDPYWQNFLKTKKWHELPFNWKYVCTHSFSVRKSVFWEVGGLKKNFIYYGFEDTDLGYRLVKAGFKLHLLDKEVFHLFHENTRSEFMNLKSLRHNLLSRTAQIFYLHHLDEDIYKNLFIYMDPEPTFERLFHRLYRTLSLQFLWKPQSQVYKSLQDKPYQ